MESGIFGAAVLATTIWRRRFGDDYFVPSCFGASAETDKCVQGRNEVRWRPGQKTSLAPLFEPEVFWKQMYYIEESTCDIVGSFRRPAQSFGVSAVIRHPHSDLAPGESSPPRPPRYAPEYV